MPVSTIGTNGLTSGLGVTASTLSVNGNNISAVNSLGFRNRIINGNMVIDQRNNGASVTPANGAYTLDRWAANNFATSARFSVQQSSLAPTGFNNSLLVTSLSAHSLASGDLYSVYQTIEGFNVADLGWGAAGAQTVTLSFWVRSSLTGTFGGAFQNDAGDRAYPFAYTISAANTWEQKTLTVAGDTTGTWLKTNGGGITIKFGLGVGSTRSSTAGAWAAGNFASSTGATSVVGTNGATFYITGVQLEAGSVATPFEQIDYGRELMMCQRYYYFLTSFSETNFGNIGLAYNYTSTQMVCLVPFPVTMRIAPALVATSGTNFYLFERNGGDDFLNSLSLSGTTTPKVGAVNNSSEISGTAGQAGRLITYTAGASVAFNAEL
jgi:hypothetical protein